MRDNSRAVLIVTLPGTYDVAGTEKKISGICGVFGVEFHPLTHKLLIRYKGKAARLLEINKEIKQVLGSTTSCPPAT